MRRGHWAILRDYYSCYLETKYQEKEWKSLPVHYVIILALVGNVPLKGSSGVS
jgi:hypothetical protein